MREQLSVRGAITLCYSKPFLRVQGGTRTCFAYGDDNQVVARRSCWLRQMPVGPFLEGENGRSGGAEGLIPFLDFVASNESQRDSKSGLEGNSIQNNLAILEAILFISREPLSARKLAVLAGLSDPTEARTLAKMLNDSYDRHGYSFRIEEIAGGLQLLTRPQFARWIRRLEIAPSEVLLSQGMLETLSIIAYRQPVGRAEIEAIRGVSCDEVLRQLMQRDLVRIAGRLEDLGRPYLYGTTRKFLQVFGLQSLEYLPRAQKIREAEAEIASRLAVQTPTAQDMAPQRAEE